MKKKCSCIILFSILFAMGLGLVPARAQSNPSSDYDYSAFRFPNIDRRALFGDVGLRSDGFVNDQTLGNDDLPNQRFNHRQNLNVTFERFRNLSKVQALARYTLGNTLHYSRENSEEIPRREREFLLMIGANGVAEYRYYYHPTRFIGYELKTSGLHNDFQRNNLTTEEFSRIVSQSFVLLPSLQYGWGRIEPIDDVFLAKFMVDDMIENGVLAELPDQEQLFELGRRMAFVRNERIFDARRLRIYELSEIDRWFEEAGLAADRSMLYFTTLNDNWLYAYRNVRFTGSRLTVGLNPGFEYGFHDSNGLWLEQKTYRLGPSAQYAHHKVLNQYWQAVTFAEIRADYLHQIIATKTDLLQPRLQVGRQYGYFPNSRTRLFANADVQYAANTSTSLKMEDQAAMANLSFSADYFVNFQFVIRAEASVGYLWGRSDVVSPLQTLTRTDNSVNYLTNLQFIYTFF